MNIIEKLKGISASLNLTVVCRMLAPQERRCEMILLWPINDATCRGVRPDCGLIGVSMFICHPLARGFLSLFNKLQLLQDYTQDSQTSVVASTAALCRINSSTIFILFFLQATCNGVKPFCLFK